MQQTPHIGRRRLRLRWWIVIGVVSAMLATWLIGGYFVIVDPVTNRLQSADAIIVLGSPEADFRINTGIELAEEHYAPVLAISAIPPLYGSTRRACDEGIAGVKVLCFQPNPTTTQGEARQIRTYAAQYGWKKIIVVTSSYHVSRARVIVERCFSGQVMMTDPMVSHSAGKIAYEYLYQTAAYVKAFLDTRSC